jgi:hypothetical protein
MAFHGLSWLQRMLALPPSPFRALLERLGGEVKEAPDGVRALALRGRGPTTPIYGLTASAGAETEAACLASCLTKPGTLARLRPTVNERPRRPEPDSLRPAPGPSARGGARSAPDIGRPPSMRPRGPDAFGDGRLGHPHG